MDNHIYGIGIGDNMAKKQGKTKRQIQIIGGEMRDIEEGEGDVTAVPPGSEFITQETMAALAGLRKRAPKADADEYDIEDDIIAARKLRDGRQKRRRGQGVGSPRRQ